MKSKLIIFFIIIILIAVSIIFLVKINNKENIVEENKANMNAVTNNVIINSDVSNFNEEQLSVLKTYVDFQQAMIDKDIDTLDKLTVDEITFTHMSGKKQTKAEFFGEVQNGTLNYYKAVISDISITINGDTAKFSSNTALTAKVYGAKGTWNLPSKGNYIKVDGIWKATN